MRRLWLGLFSAVALALLLTGCGGGGGGGVTPPPSGDVARLFPLAQGTQWVYDSTEKEHFYFKVTGSVAMEKRSWQWGPFSVPIVIPKPPLSLRNTTHTYEEIMDKEQVGTDSRSIVGTHTGDPFPPEVTTSIEETHFQGHWKESWEAKIDGQTVDKGTQGGDTEGWDRSFYTNINGEVKLWGEQHMEDSEWGDIEAYDPPLLFLKADATSWKVGHIEMDMEGAVFSGDIVANLVGQETITVPAGTFQCYKIVYKLVNAKLGGSPPGVQITSWNLQITLTLWLALDKGIVKSTQTTSLNATFKDPDSGATGSVSMSSTQTSVLKQ